MENTQDTENVDTVPESTIAPNLVSEHADNTYIKTLPITGEKFNLERIMYYDSPDSARHYYNLFKNMETVPGDIILIDTSIMDIRFSIAMALQEANMNDIHKTEEEKQSSYNELKNNIGNVLDMYSEIKNYNTDGDGLIHFETLTYYHPQGRTVDDFRIYRPVNNTMLILQTRLAFYRQMKEFHQRWLEVLRSNMYNDINIGLVVPIIKSHSELTRFCAHKITGTDFEDCMPYFKFFIKPIEYNIDVPVENKAEETEADFRNNFQKYISKILSFFPWRGTNEPNEREKEKATSELMNYIQHDYKIQICLLTGKTNKEAIDRNSYARKRLYRPIYYAELNEFIIERIMEQTFGETSIQEILDIEYTLIDFNQLITASKLKKNAYSGKQLQEVVRDLNRMRITDEELVIRLFETDPRITNNVRLKALTSIVSRYTKKVSAIKDRKTFGERILNMFKWMFVKDNKQEITGDLILNKIENKQLRKYIYRLAFNKYLFREMRRPDVMRNYIDLADRYVFSNVSDIGLQHGINQKNKYKISDLLFISHFESNFIEENVDISDMEAADYDYAKRNFNTDAKFRNRTIFLNQIVERLKRSIPIIDRMIDYENHIKDRLREDIKQLYTT